MTKVQTCGDDVDDRHGDIMTISRAMTRMRLMIGRRIIGRLAIGNLAPELELSHLDVIEAVIRNQADGEATVGSIAETMRIDPSRGSRLVSDLVQRGMLRRAASQEDARRTVVELTDSARALIKETQSIKLDLIESFVADWEPDDIARFATLFMRFVDEFENSARARETKPEADA